MLPAVCCGLGSCACAQGAREDLHADGAESKQRRAHRQVQLPAGFRAQPSNSPHTGGSSNTKMFSTISAPSNGENRI